MEIRNIKTFVRLAEIQNFSKVAQQTGYSQSAITIQIKQLEEELGAKLFERIGKRVKLTEAGQRLIPHALEILNSVKKAEAAVHETGTCSGKLRIGTCESYLISVLPPIIEEFSDKFPDAQISTHTASVSDLFDMLRQNDVDILYFLDEKVYSPEWIKVDERPERIYFVASSKSRLAGKVQIPVQELLKEPLYLTEKSISYRYAMEQALAAKGIELRPFLETGNTDVITSFLLKNKGVSFLPEYVVRDYVNENRLTILNADCPQITMWSQLVYHKNKYVTPLMEQFLKLMAG